MGWKKLARAAAAALIAGLTVLPAAEAAPAYDISRVTAVKADFPPGFTVAVPPLRTLSQHDVEDPEFASVAGARIDPPQCRPVVVPPYAVPVVGTQAAGVTADGVQGSIDVFALRSPKPVPSSTPPPGCDRVSVSGDPEVTGVGEQVPAPNIAGVTTTALKLTADEEPQEPEYLFTAVLDDQTAVIVTGSADAQLNPQQLLSDLLVKAAAAVRGP